MIFLDTSAAFAMVNAEDEFHEGAIHAFEKLLDDGRVLLTHNYVLLEAVSLLQRRGGLTLALTLHRDLQRFSTMHWITEEEHRQAFQLWDGRNTRHLSLVDCMSFIVMEMYGIKQAFAYDSDFEAEGFQLVG